MVRLLLSLILCAPVEFIVAFQSPRINHCHPTTSTTTLNIFGRFRKNKRQVEPEIAPLIEEGSALPEGDVQVLTVQDGQATTIPVTIHEALGTGTSILVGMPGAFTPTCTSEHLPGYMFAAPTLQELGVDQIAVLTTNDQFVNEEWARNVGLLTKEGEVETPAVAMLSDGDSDYVKQLGLAEDMGFGVGVRSKRFAMIVKEGKCENLFVDEGMDDCSSTSAAKMVEFLTPEPEVLESEGLELTEEQLQMVGGAVAILLLAWMASYADFSPDPTAVKATQPIVPAMKSSVPEESFGLLKEFMK